MRCRRSLRSCLRGSNGWARLRRVGYSGRGAAAVDRDQAGQGRPGELSTIAVGCQRGATMIKAVYPERSIRSRAATRIWCGARAGCSTSSYSASPTAGPSARSSPCRSASRSRGGALRREEPHGGRFRGPADRFRAHAECARGAARPARSVRFRVRIPARGHEPRAQSGIRNRVPHPRRAAHVHLATLVREIATLGAMSRSSSTRWCARSSPRR